MAPVPFLLFLFLAAAAAAAASPGEGQGHGPRVHRPIHVPPAGCPDKCGNISIPYPFGMGKPGCFRENFEVVCNHSFTPPRAFLWKGTGRPLSGGSSHGTSATSYLEGEGEPVELMDISLNENEVRAYSPVSSYLSVIDGTGSAVNDGVPNTQFTFLGSPFTLSRERNSLVGIGPSSMDFGLVEGGLSRMGYFATCRTNLLLVSTGQDGLCDGQLCCRKSGYGMGDLNSFGVIFDDPGHLGHESPSWYYGMVVESSWYNFSKSHTVGYDKKFSRGVPFIIDFAIINITSLSQGVLCPAVQVGQQPPQNYACVSNHSYCANATNGYVCHCSKHFNGNPYITDGCKDINECDNHQLYPCYGICKNTVGGYDCPCKPGMKGDGKAGTCTLVFSTAAKGTVGAIGGILLTVIVSFLAILRNEKKKMGEFFKKTTLEKANVIRLFKKEELKPILQNSNLIGRGCFGEVYKGLLDNKTVAIKKPINGSVLERDQFANEVIIQSQVIHKNIVRLIGCCFEVDALMLVYEFISHGSLHDILHSNHNKVALNLDARLSIAAQSAEGLAYMHSKANIRILHGDIKPENILLDDNFAPKISDFGISRLLAREKECSASVIGDKNYMDPVYQQEGLLTEKSDVYSFGVVILELISRRRAIHSENNSLVKSFLEAYEKQEKATELFDKKIAIAEDLELLDSLAGMAIECLSLDVDTRPTMMEVAQRLDTLSRSRKVKDVCH